MRTAFKGPDWLGHVLRISDAEFDDIHDQVSGSKHAAQVRWFEDQGRDRVRQVRQVVHLYAPWLLPEFSVLKDDPAINLQCRPDEVTVLKWMPAFIDSLTVRLEAAVASASDEEAGALYRRLLSRLPAARARVVRLIADLKEIAHQASGFADEMDFRFLLNRKRRLLSVGFDVDTQELHPACYDLLATESRVAVFGAIAKDDIPQESWFLLGRAHTLDQGRAILLSWTGTMFEYLMPALWMRIYEDTLLERSAVAVVRSQRAYAADRRMPWGISESAYFRTDELGNYQYYAFGVPHLAIHKLDQDPRVVSPYSTFLALHVDSSAALRNLRRMHQKRWLGTYGFYEAVDFHPSRCRSWLRRFEPVRCWMAHHQGMSLLSMANFLHQGIVQHWFHSHPRVQATELLLQEKPATHVRPQRQRRKAA